MTARSTASTVRDCQCRDAGLSALCLRLGRELDDQDAEGSPAGNFYLGNNRINLIVDSGRDDSNCASRYPVSQAVRECGKRIGKLSRRFRRRQRYLQALTASGWISLDPGVLRAVGIVGSRQSSNKLRTNLH